MQGPLSAEEDSGTSIQVVEFAEVSSVIFLQEIGGMLGHTRSLNFDSEIRRSTQKLQLKGFTVV